MAFVWNFMCLWNVGRSPGSKPRLVQAFVLLSYVNTYMGGNCYDEEACVCVFS